MWWVAPVPVTHSTKVEGAPGPSRLGPGIENRAVCAQAFGTAKIAGSIVLFSSTVFTEIPSWN